MINVRQVWALSWRKRWSTWLILLTFPLLEALKKLQALETLLLCSRLAQNMDLEGWSVSPQATNLTNPIHTFPVQSVLSTDKNLESGRVRSRSSSRSSQTDALYRLFALGPWAMQDDAVIRMCFTMPSTLKLQVTQNMTWHKAPIKEKTIHMINTSLVWGPCFWISE